MRQGRTEINKMESRGTVVSVTRGPHCWEENHGSSAAGKISESRVKPVSEVGGPHPAERSTWCSPGNHTH